MERTIEIAGKKLPVKFTMRSLKVYEEITGRNLLNENCLDIIRLQLGVDALVAFVYASILIPKGGTPPITVEELELEMGFDNSVFTEVVEAYTDFLPGLAAIKKRIMADPELVKKIQAAGNNPEKIKAIYAELLQDPNGKSQET